MGVYRQLRGFQAAWTSLPSRSKWIYGSFVFNGGLIIALLIQGARSSRKSSKLWQQHMQQVDEETQGWRCYEIAKLLREQCHEETLLLLHLQEQTAAAAAARKGQETPPAAEAAAEKEGEDKLCRRVLEGLRECREEIYKEIETLTPPAMLPLPSIVNRPTWLKEPLWYRQLEQQQQHQLQQQQQQ